MIFEESMKAEINKQCPKVATKKTTHIFGPPQKCMTADAGGMHGEGRDGRHGNRDRGSCVVVIFKL